MVFNNPIGVDKADRVIDLLELPPGARALDAGCGTGEFLIRLVSRHPSSGVGVDRDPRCIATARGNATARGVASRCEFIAADARDYSAEPGAFDLAACIGATHAFGSGEAAYPEATSRLVRLVRPGGYLLIGEGYWKQDPSADYLELIGDPVGIYRDHAGNISFAEERGLVALYATVSSDDEWDDFEWRHQLRILREAESDPRHPDSPERVSRSRRWRDGYLRWGRSTMGFGLYLFRVPGGAK